MSIRPARVGGTGPPLPPSAGLKRTMTSIRKRTWARGGQERTAWVVDYFDQHGKRRLKTCREAETFKATAKYEIDRGIHTPESASITVKEAVDLWLEHGEAEELEVRHAADLSRVMAVAASDRQGRRVFGRAARLGECHDARPREAELLRIEQELQRQLERGVPCPRRVPAPRSPTRTGQAGSLTGSGGNASAPARSGGARQRAVFRANSWCRQAFARSLSALTGGRM